MAKKTDVKSKTKTMKMADHSKLEDISQMSLDLASCTDISQEPAPELLEQLQPIQPKPKQYLLLADELHMTILGKLIPGLLFVEVEGLPMKDSTEYMLLANPVNKPKTE